MLQYCQISKHKLKVLRGYLQCFWFLFCFYGKRTAAGLLSSCLPQLLSLVSQRHLSLCCWMLHQCDACMYKHTQLPVPPLCFRIVYTNEQEHVMWWPLNHRLDTNSRSTCDSLSSTHTSAAQDICVTAAMFCPSGHSPVVGNLEHSGLECIRS